MQISAQLGKTWMVLLPGLWLVSGLGEMAYCITYWSFQAAVAVTEGQGLGMGSMVHQAIFTPFPGPLYNNLNVSIS